MTAAARPPLPDAVSQAYQHRPKSVRPSAPLLAAGSRLKWYNLVHAGAGVAPGIEDQARRFLGARGVPPGPGFVILHRCGEDFHFLIVSTWKNDNELWETLCARPGPDQPEFAPWPMAGEHRATFCVWELGIVWHETQAWKRFLGSPRGAADLAAWYGAQFEGTV